MSLKILEELKADYNFLGIENENASLGHIPGLKAPDWIHEGPIYEIFTRVYSKEGTFEQITNKVKYIKDLGVKTIWLMPIHPIGRKGRKGTLGSPYAIVDFFAINKDYGTEQEFKTLISEIHGADMKIILDLVPNHAANDHVLIHKKPDFFLHDKEDNFARKFADWTDVTDFDYNNRQVSAYMLDIMSYWVKEFDIDGYRCDVAGMVPLNFWKTASHHLQKLKEDIFLLAEWESNRLHEHAFHACYDWTLYLILEDIHKQRRPASDCLRWVEYKRTQFPQNALPLRFTENHDHPRTVTKFGVKSCYPYIGLHYALYGVPLLYAGQEIGSDFTPSIEEKDEIQWDHNNQSLLSYYKKLIQLRQVYPSLASKKIRIIQNNHFESVVSFEKAGDDGSISIVLNFSGNNLNVVLNYESCANEINFKDLISERYIKMENQMGLKLKPYEVLYLKALN